MRYNILRKFKILEESKDFYSVESEDYLSGWVQAQAVVKKVNHFKFLLLATTK